VKQTLTSWLQTLDTDFFCTGQQAFLPQREKCLNVSVDYLEVWHVPSATHVLYMQGVSRLVDVTAGGDFLDLFDQ